MHPFDDLHRFHRPAALLAAVKGYSMETAIDYLHPPNRVDNIDEVGLSVMRALGIKRR